MALPARLKDMAQQKAAGKQEAVLQVLLRPAADAVSALFSALFSVFFLILFFL